MEYRNTFIYTYFTALSCFAVEHYWFFHTSTVKWVVQRSHVNLDIVHITTPINGNQRKLALISDNTNEMYIIMKLQVPSTHLESEKSSVSANLASLQPRCLPLHNKWWFVSVCETCVHIAKKQNIHSCQQIASACVRDREGNIFLCVFNDNYQWPSTFHELYFQWYNQVWQL